MLFFPSLPSKCSSLTPSSSLGSAVYWSWTSPHWWRCLSAWRMFCLSIGEPDLASTTWTTSSLICLLQLESFGKPVPNIQFCSFLQLDQLFLESLAGRVHSCIICTKKTHNVELCVVIGIINSAHGRGWSGWGVVGGGWWVVVVWVCGVGCVGVGRCE